MGSSRGPPERYPVEGWICLRPFWSILCLSSDSFLSPSPLLARSTLHCVSDRHCHCVVCCYGCVLVCLFGWRVSNDWRVSKAPQFFIHSDDYLSLLFFQLFHALWPSRFFPDLFLLSISQNRYFLIVRNCSLAFLANTHTLTAPHNRRDRK